MKSESENKTIPKGTSSRARLALFRAAECCYIAANSTKLLVTTCHLGQYTC